MSAKEFKSDKANRLFNKLQNITLALVKQLEAAASLTGEINKPEFIAKVDHVKFDRYIAAFNAANQIDQAEAYMERHIQNLSQPKDPSKVYH